MISILYTLKQGYGTNVGQFSMKMSNLFV